MWADPADPPPDCHPVTHAVLTHFAAGRIYGNLTAPELCGGEGR
nr:hypothetical protein OG409_00575 [Streptomyces sp. NBC_00974]WSX54253.1 hypothetical protein OG409_38340 [Streptomyces sp. NBC_00974]